MPWKGTDVMDLKTELIGQWLKNEYTISELVRGYGLSRKTVYKWVRRYQADGPAGLAARSSAPRHCPHAVADEVAQRIVAVKLAHPSFGPRKVMDWLRAHEPDESWPADSTTGDLLKAVGLVKKRRYKRPYPADPQPFELGNTPNALWSVDYKGQYPSAGGQWCYPLTLTDNASRYLLGCHGVTGTDYAQARAVFERVFEEYGLPDGLLSDNGSIQGSRTCYTSLITHRHLPFFLQTRFVSAAGRSRSQTGDPARCGISRTRFRHGF